MSSLQAPYCGAGTGRDASVEEAKSTGTAPRRAGGLERAFASRVSRVHAPNKASKTQGFDLAGGRPKRGHAARR
jgi:hypothetical protein